MSLELLKLLTPKSVSLERSSRGRDALSWEDIAAALATTRPLASLYARLCYTRDTSKIEILEQKLLVAVVEADELQSTVIKISALRDLIKLSLIEAYHGQQFPVREKNSDVFSSKKIRLDKISMLELGSASSWYRKYQPIYAVILGIFATLERETSRALKDSQKG